MLKASELSLIFRATDKTDAAFELLNEVARAAVRKAYSNPEDKGEYARTLFQHCADSLKSGLARFYRACGLNVTLDGKRDTLSTIGDVLDRSRQAKVFETLDEREAFVLDMADKVKKGKTAPDGTWAEQADKAIKGLIARQKKEHPEVAGIINQRLQRPGWMVQIETLGLSDAEVEEVVEFVVMLRMQQRKAA